MNTQTCDMKEKAAAQSLHQHYISSNYVSHQNTVCPNETLWSSTQNYHVVLSPATRRELATVSNEERKHGRAADAKTVGRASCPGAETARGYL